ncbi:MAG TPA: DUF4255 domain-containing protein [Acidimicrobiales bacterium]|nr:DUF4255 domain-containing protein [Acidimicrobiales bacterium]
MYDLSVVTDRLVQLMTDALQASPIWGGGPPSFSVGITSQSPEQTQLNADTDLNVFLFHLGEDTYQKNAFWSAAGQAGPLPPLQYQPACYDLFYLVSARSQSSHVNEQQVLGVALKALHDNAIVALSASPPFRTGPSEVTVTMEHPTWDELCRLWQGLSTPMRATAVYRVSVVFLTPEQPPADAPEVLSMTVTASPAQDVSDLAPGASALPELIGTSRVVTYNSPSGPASYVMTPATLSPALGGAGPVADVRASGFAPGDLLFLEELGPDGTALSETDITGSWTVPIAPPYTSVPVGGEDVRIQAPANLGSPPLCPPPGYYQIRAGSPSEPAWRSSAVPLGIAPWISPAGGPLLSATPAGMYSCQVNNVPVTGAQVRLGTVALSHKASGLLSPGQWSLTGTTLKFKAPSTLPPGHHALRLRVNGVEADPALWAVVP